MPKKESESDTLSPTYDFFPLVPVLSSENTQSKTLSLFLHPKSFYSRLNIFPFLSSSSSDTVIRLLAILVILLSIGSILSIFVYKSLKKSYLVFK